MVPQSSAVVNYCRITSGFHILHYIIYIITLKHRLSAKASWRVESSKALFGGASVRFDLDAEHSSVFSLLCIFKKI